MPVTLYRKQKQILEYLRKYISKHGYSPTLQEIADHMKLSSLATVHEHLQTLAKKGVIKRFEGAVRGMEIIDHKIGEALEGIELPLMGFIAAGKPIEAIADPTQTITVSPEITSTKKKSFVLQVKGDSMVEDGILDGDYVVIEQNNTANNGDIVVALLNNGFATLKRFFRDTKKKMIRLEPANSQMEPIYTNDVEIQGKVKGLIRRF